MTIVKVLSAEEVNPLTVLLALIVKLAVPIPVGVPEITLLELLRPKVLEEVTRV
jgi:hypothetical protein